MSRTHATVHVPGSTSNLGSGFDCIGIAVDLWLTASVTIDRGAHGVTSTRSGTLTSVQLDAAEDLIVVGYAAACARAGCDVPGALAFTAGSAIPVARGLGSSAAALVAGAALADETLELGLGRHGIATLVSQIEGHPDNASPCTFGGAMLGVANDDALGDRPLTYAFSAIPVHASLAFVYAIPPLEVTTAAARAVLPEMVPFADAVRALQRSVALAQGLSSGEPALLARALDDVLHVPYRRHLVPGYDAVVHAAREAGAFGATLSGSGSALVAVTTRAETEAVAAAMQRAFGEHGLACETLVMAGAVPGLRVELEVARNPPPAARVR